MSEWSHGSVHVNGLKMHYCHTGSDRPPVILAHGFTDNGLCWTPVAKDLEAEYRVIMPDARGHGLSDRVEPDTPVDLAADLAGLIQALGLARPAALGHSMGAATVAQVAARFPKLVSAILLEDPPWFEHTPGAQDAAAHDSRTAWRQRTIEKKAQTRAEVISAGKAEHPTWSDDELGPWADASHQVDINVFTWPLQMLYPWREIVSRFTCPTMLITGDPELGSLVTPSASREVARVRPAIEFTHIAGAGHSIRREQYGPYIEAVTRFLADHLKP